MNDSEKILSALKQVLDYELKAINILISIPKEGNNLGSEAVYEEIKRRMAEELREAELLIKQAAFMNFMRIRQASEKADRNIQKKHRGKKKVQN